MVKYFLYGSLLYSLLISIGFVIEWVVARINKKKYSTVFDEYSFGLNLVGYVVIFSFLLSISDKYLEVAFFKIIIGVLFITSIVSYFHLIAPIRHLFNIGKTQDFYPSFLSAELSEGYHFK